MTDTTRESVERWEVTHNANGLGFSDGIRQSPHGNFVALSDYAALEAERDALQAKLDAQGRELNRVKYGEPDFAWSIHKAAMADLQAKLALAVEAMKGFESWDECWPGNINLEAECRKARSALATITADTQPKGER